MGVQVPPRAPTFMKELLRVKRKIDSKWVECEFPDLREGDIYVQIMTPKYQQLIGSCLAKSDAYFDAERETWSIDSEMLHPHAEDPDAEFYEDQN